MIADQMNLNLLYDTNELQYTEVIDTKSDQALLPYTVGYIPWDWVKDSELFSWSAVNCQALYANGMRIFMTRAETDLTDLSATRGVPFLWALSAVLEGTTHNALYRDSDDQYVTDQSYANILAFPNYSAIKKFDISGMANTSDTVHYVRYLCIYSLLDDNGNMTSTGGCYGNRTAFHPFSKTIDTINLTCTLSGVTYTATFDTDKFKTVTSSTPYTETVQNGDTSVKFLVYITGITCCTSRLTTSPTKQYITGLTIGQTRYRYPAMIGDQATNAYAYGRPMYRPFASDSATTSRYSGTGAYFAFSTQTQTYDFLVNKRHISADIFELSSRLYYSNADSVLVYNGGTEGSFAFYSYTYQDVCTLSMISQPAISYNGVLYTQEFDDYVLTGNWVPVTDANKLVNPDTNLFDPDDDIPDPDVPSDDGDDDTRKRNENTNLPEFDGIRLVSGTGFTSFYLLSAYHINELGHILSSMPQTFWEALGTATDYKMSNVLSYISALKWYPLPILESAPDPYPDVPTSDIQFGFAAATKIPLSSAGSSYKLGTVNRVFSMGSVYIPYRSSGTQTFLDLEPYTDVYINLPYIGKQQLQANQVLGYTVSVHYVVDLITGMCTCLVDNGYDTLFVGSGKIGVDITVAGNDVITQSERMTSAYIGTVTHAISNSLSLGGAVALEDASGAVTGFSGMISGLVSDCISTANAKRGVPQVVGGGSGFGSTYAAQTPCIIVQRPAVKIPASYGHSVGYVYNTYARIGSLSGYTVCDNPDLSGVPATSTELDMIRQILATGFYA